ncbi:MAG: N-6 DNA methylase [Promethearchaeota archaeon]
MNVGFPLIGEEVGGIPIKTTENEIEELVSGMLGSLSASDKKLLATFYTNSTAAQILAGLTVGRWDSTVIDPACGSGSLLTAAYDRKLELFMEQAGRKRTNNTEAKRVHRLFLEKQLTGIEIMPLAAKIAAMRLAFRNPEAEYDKIRIAVYDSLDLSNEADRLKTNGIKMKSVPKSALTFSETGSKKDLLLTSQNKSEIGRKEFRVRQHDVLIMNPPFTDRKKIPSSYRKKLDRLSRITSKCGSQVNLWGPFLALADDLVREGGRIGAVIPINIGRGKATQKIRTFILNNYRMLYIIKPTRNLAFSELAAFRDVLVILEKTKPSDSDMTMFVLIKKPLKDLTDSGVKSLIDKINRIKDNIHDIFSCDSVEVIPISHRELTQKNLMEFIWGFSAQNMRGVDRFLKAVRTRSRNKLTSFPTGKIMEGFHTSPERLSQVLFITDPRNKRRIVRASLVFLRKDTKHVFFKSKSTEEIIKLPVSAVEKGLKTVIGLDTLDVTNLNDYIIVRSPSKEALKKIIEASEYGRKEIPWTKIEKERKKKTYVTVFRRFSPTSKNTHFLSLYSEVDLIPTDAFKVFRAAKTESKIFCLFLNSVISVVRLLQNMQQTTGTYVDIKEEDFERFDFISLESLEESEIADLLSLFDKLREIKFPSILEQFENKFWGRVELDRFFLKILGFSDEEVGKWQPIIYRAIVDELKALKSTC